MVSVVMAEGILIIASIIAAAGISTMAINKVGTIQSIFASTTEAHKEIALTKIETIYATNSSSTLVQAWVKNIGTAPIKSLDKVDIYFGKLDAVSRIPYNVASTPKWTFGAGTDTSLWQTKDTIQIDIASDADLEKNITYMIRISTPNGVSNDYVFSIS